MNWNIFKRFSASPMTRAKKYVGADATVILDGKGRVLTVWPNTEQGFRTPSEPGERLKKINEEERIMLRACLEKHRADLLAKVNLIETGQLEDAVINEMREAVGTEFLYCGFRDDCEPNEYGLKLEEVIAVLGHYWKSQFNRLY